MAREQMNAKSIRRYAAVLTAAVMLLALAAPYISAKYTSPALFEVEDGVFEAYIDTGVSGVSNEDLDALMDLIFEAKYPPGSIYMTTDPGFDPNEVFPGSWALWGVDKVPVGIDAGNRLDGTGTPVNTSVFDFRSLSSTGGTGNGTSAAAVTVPATSFPANALGLTNGSVDLINESFSISGGSVNISKTTALQSEEAQLTIGLLPQHTHGSTLWIKVYDNRQASSSPTRYTMASQAGNTSTETNQFPTDGSWFTGSTIPNTDVNKFGVLLDETGKGDKFRFTYSIDWTQFGRGMSGHTYEYNKPTVGTYPQQTISHDLKLGDGTATMPDNTIQPYLTCYMYRRALA